jgi:hypothetical protein
VAEPPLQQGDQITQSDSLPELITRMTGSDIPVAALFDWLQGKNTAVTALADRSFAHQRRPPACRPSARHPRPLAYCSRSGRSLIRQPGAIVAPFFSY